MASSACHQVGIGAWFCPQSGSVSLPRARAQVPVRGPFLGPLEGATDGNGRAAERRRGRLVRSLPTFSQPRRDRPRQKSTRATIHPVRRIRSERSGSTRKDSHRRQWRPSSGARAGRALVCESRRGRCLKQPDLCDGAAVVYFGSISRQISVECRISPTSMNRATLRHAICRQPFMTPMRSIVYSSSATHELTVAQLETLLAEARAFNHQHAVTGVLLYSGWSFMQCFEGASEDVEKVYERIKRSSQHMDIVEYWDCSIPRRTFRAWDMGLTKPTESEILTLASAKWSKLTKQSFPPQARHGLSMLKVFWSMRRGIH